jgi:hypothetical protein
MRLIFTVFLAVVFSVLSCSGQNYQFILIEQNKIELRYSTRNDVEKLLGRSEKTQYFEHGGEGFSWENFTVCFYDTDSLFFHYDQNDAIIRITVYTSNFREIIFMGNDIKNITKEDILEQIKTLEGRDAFISEDFISYFVKQAENIEICYSFWFYNTGKLRIMDVYYVRPW